MASSPDNPSATGKEGRAPFAFRWFLAGTPLGQLELWERAKGRSRAQPKPSEHSKAAAKLAESYKRKTFVPTR